MNLVQNNLAALYRDHPQLDCVCLVAISKYASVEQIKAAYDFGIRDFGENKIQDFETKQAQLPTEMQANIRWHFVGHLQKNKAKKTIPNRFSLIHSLDSLELATMLHELNCHAGTCQDMLIQVNLTREIQKTGFLEEELLAAYPQLLMLKGIRLVGLMTIGWHQENVKKIKDLFSHLHDLRDQLVATYSHPLPELSMGMSQDFVHAIECGATIIRVGNRIFGHT